MKYQDIEHVCVLRSSDKMSRKPWQFNWIKEDEDTLRIILLISFKNHVMFSQHKNPINFPINITSIFPDTS